jgi:hypothetical protein
MFLTNLLTAEVPGFITTVGALESESLPFLGGLIKSNADSPEGPRITWALWETLSNATSALQTAAPLIEIPAGATSNMYFSADTHLEFDGGISEWVARDNGYSQTYKPFVILGDSFSNLSLHLFDKEFVYIPNPDVPLSFIDFATSGDSVSIEYELLDDLVDVVARVFPVTRALSLDSNAEPGNPPAAGEPTAQFYQLSNTTGTHEAYLGGLAHTTRHRLVVETLDLAGFYRRDFYDFSTAYASSPIIHLDEASAGAEGVVELSWTASDSNDGGISRILAFSGSNPPAPPEGLRGRLESGEQAFAFPGVLPDYRTLSAQGGSPQEDSASISTAEIQFSNMTDVHHLSHYVQLVAENSATQFHADSNYLTAVDFGAEVPAMINNDAAHDLPVRFSNTVGVYQLSFETDTISATAHLLNMSETAAALLFSGGDPVGADAAAASNIWSLIEVNSNAWAPAMDSASLFGVAEP